MWRFVSLVGVLAASAGILANFVPGELLAKARPGRDLALSIAAAEIGASPIERIAGIGVWRLRLPTSTSVTAAARRLCASPGVAYAEPNAIAHALFVPNDPRYPEQWGLPKVQAPGAWDWTFGLPSVVVAVVDTGIDLAHPDLVANLVPGIGFVGNPNGDDDNGHGTAVAGIASAATNNALGIAGLGFSCRLMPVKVLTAGGSGTFSDVANGIVWAADHGAKVINLSLGGASPSQALEDAVNYAWARGCVLVAAAGGSGSQNPTYPAYYENCVAVAASDQNDARASFSSYGDWVEVAAPGVSIVTTWDSGGYQVLSGTSFSTALVSGEAALVASVLGGGTSTDVRARIERTADPVGNWVRFGRINATRATADAAAQVLAPTSAQTTRGFHVSGGLEDLWRSDDRHYVIEPRFPFSARDPSAQLVVETVANNAPMRSLAFTCETRASGIPTRALIVRIELFNALAGGWEIVDERESSLTDARTTVRISGAERFKRAEDNVLAARISWFDRGVASPGWSAWTDWLMWQVN